MKHTILIVLSMLVNSVVSAATWNVVSVEQGSDGGFGFSGLHDASGSNVMSGAGLADITSASGTYDDVSGDANFTFSLSNSTSFNLTGNLIFNSSGWLASNSTLAYSGLTLSGISSTGDFGYMPGDVCCGGSYDPNSFMPTTGNLNFLTLWGADGFNTNNGTYSNSTIGMDFRLGLAPSAVPLPAAAWLFAPALLGVLGIRRKKKS